MVAGNILVSIPSAKSRQAHHLDGRLLSPKATGINYSENTQI